MDRAKLQNLKAVKEQVVINDNHTTSSVKFKRELDNFEYGTFSPLINKSGIYQIKNLLTNKIYIGSSKDIGRRLQKHFSELRFNRHTNKRLQSDFNKFSIENFEWSVIEYTSENLIDKERNYQIEIGIESLYNDKISNYYMNEELKSKLASVDKSSHKTKEYREKMSLLKSHAIVQYDKNGNPINKYDNMNNLLKENPNYKGQTIRGACNGSKYQAYGFFWRYLNPDGSVKEIEK